MREDCLEYALTNSEKFGIWGGMSERERRRIRRQRALAQRCQRRLGIELAERRRHFGADCATANRFGGQLPTRPATCAALFRSAAALEVNPVST